MPIGNVIGELALFVCHRKAAHGLGEVIARRVQRQRQLLLGHIQLHRLGIVKAQRGHALLHHTCNVVGNKSFVHQCGFLADPPHHLCHL